MPNYSRLVFVDVEATGITSYSGVMTEFGAVHYETRETFHGRLFDSEPSKENPAIPVITGMGYAQEPVMREFAAWLSGVVTGNPTFVSDNPAYDFMWIAYYCDQWLGYNPFGHSARRIGDFWAGTQRNWGDAQKWKRFRQTKHDHNPVNDAMGNVEAFETILEIML